MVQFPGRWSCSWPTHFSGHFPVHPGVPSQTGCPLGALKSLPWQPCWYCSHLLHCRPSLFWMHHPLLCACRAVFLFLQHLPLLLPPKNSDLIFNILFKHLPSTPQIIPDFPVSQCLPPVGARKPECPPPVRTHHTVSKFLSQPRRSLGMGTVSCSPRPSQCLAQCLEITGTQISELQHELERSKTWGWRLEGQKGGWGLGRESAGTDEGKNALRRVLICAWRRGEKETRSLASHLLPLFLFPGKEPRYI